MEIKQVAIDSEVLLIDNRSHETECAGASEDDFAWTGCHLHSPTAEG